MKYLSVVHGDKFICKMTAEEARACLLTSFTESFVDDLIDNQKNFRLQTAYRTIWTQTDEGLVMASGTYGAVESDAEKKVEAFGEWIPIDRKPDESDTYLVAWLPKNSERETDECFVGIAEFGFGEWATEDIELLEFFYLREYREIELLAWMPLPEMYKIGGEKKDKK